MTQITLIPFFSIRYFLAMLKNMLYRFTQIAIRNFYIELTFKY